MHIKKMRKNSEETKSEDEDDKEKSSRYCLDDDDKIDGGCRDLFKNIVKVSACHNM